MAGGGLCQADRALIFSHRSDAIETRCYSILRFFDCSSGVPLRHTIETRVTDAVRARCYSTRLGTITPIDNPITAALLPLD